MTTTLTSGLLRSPSHDPYARITELDEATSAALAQRFEICASNAQQHRLWTEFLARTPLIERARVLEVGCGTGIITAKIADLPGMAEAVGVDPSPYFIDRARRRAPGLRFDVADGRALPFADHSFDGVVFATTLCHVPRPEAALVEAHRVLRPGGYLQIYDGDYATTTVAVHDQDPLQTCVDAAISALVHDPWLVRRLTPLVVDAGFVPGELRSHGYLELDNPTYLPSLVAVGVDRLAATGAITTTMAAALKTEAHDRAQQARFFGHIAYASLLAFRPAPEQPTSGVEEQ